MSTRHLFLVAALGLLGSATAAGMVACSSSDNNNGPTNHPDSGSPPNDSGGGQDSATSCQPAGDAGTCNANVTPQQDPYNACSSATANCIPFDDTRVPKDPSCNVPQVP
jgi:hypothetical protein